MVIDPGGRILGQASGAEEQILSMDLDREQVIQARRRFPFFRDRRPDNLRGPHRHNGISPPVRSVLSRWPRPPKPAQFSQHRRILFPNRIQGALRGRHQNGS